jgi:hypothetical protein
MMARSPIDGALVEIGRGYRQGLLAWLKEHLDRWAGLLEIESSINSTTLVGDEAGLRVALEGYKDFFEEMVALFDSRG